MIIAAPNLALDRTVRIGELRPGHVLRFTGATAVPGGKGVNVARAVRPLGGYAVLVSLVPGRTGGAAAGLVTEEGIRLRAVRCTGEARVAVTVLEESGRVTVMNEPGPQIVPAAWAEFTQAVSAEMTSAVKADAGRWLVCSGSVQPGIPASAYADLVAAAHAEGWSAFVDAGGELLERALAAEPDVVSPNLAEAEGVLTGTPVDDEVQASATDARDRATAAAQGLRGRGARAAVVTAGAAGVAVATAETELWVPAPQVTVVNPVGAGDAFAAGFVTALERGESFERAVLEGVAAATASVETAIAGRLSRTRVADLLAAIDAAASPR